MMRPQPCAPARGPVSSRRPPFELTQRVNYRGPHGRERGLDGDEVRGQVDVEDALPLRELEGLDRRHVLDAGVVHEDGHGPPEAARRHRHHVRDLVGFSHVRPVVSDLNSLGARRGIRVSFLVEAVRE